MLSKNDNFNTRLQPNFVFKFLCSAAVSSARVWKSFPKLQNTVSINVINIASQAKNSLIFRLFYGIL